MIYRISILFLFWLAFPFFSVPVQSKTPIKSIAVALVSTDTLLGASSFTTVRTIDLRADQSNIGISTIGLRRLQLVTADSLSLVVDRLATDFIQKATTKKNQELVILLYDLTIYDRIPLAQKVSNIHLNMECYLGSDGNYTKVVAVDTLYEFYVQPIAGLLYATSYLITQNIRAAAVTDAENDAPYKTLPQILAGKMELRQQMPAYTQPPKRGVYYTYEQFKNNTPADTAVFAHHYLADGFHYYKFYLNSLSGKDRINLADTPVYAISKNDKWYRPAPTKDFHEMIRTDGDYYYYAFADGLFIQDYGGGIYVAASPVGIIGSLVAMGITQGLQEREKHKPRRYAEAIFYMKLDPRTGAGIKQYRIQ